MFSFQAKPSCILLLASCIGQSLSIAVPSNKTKCPLGPGLDHHPIVNSSTWPYQTYHSAPYQPPVFDIQRNGKPLARGHILITPSNLNTEPVIRDVAPAIFSDGGELIWNGPSVNATNFRVASYKGKDTLTYWGGLSTNGANTGHGYGNVTFLDSSYQPILTVCKFNPDTSEFPPQVISFASPSS